MHKTLKYFHLLGLVLFLGSIVVYTLMSIMTQGGELRDLLFAREVIRAGTLFVTSTGLWMLVITGVALASFGRGFGPLWIKQKVAISVVILVLANLLIIPATAEALLALREALPAGEVSGAYQAAYLKETVPGIINVILTLLATAIAVKRTAVKSV